MARRVMARATRLPAHVPGRMNKLEERYAERLRVMQAAGEVACWFFEPAGFRLGDGCFYHPDFMVIMPDGAIEFHETKGYWRDDARVKVKAFADKFPFVVRGVQYKKGQWITENF